MIKALLLAAGFGTRLRPLTDIWPKCLMPISGIPLLEIWLYTLKNCNINSVVVNTHHHSRHVRNFLNRKKFNGWVNCFHEDLLLGTAGTLRKNIIFFRDNITLLIHADNFCHCDFSSFINYHLHLRQSHCLITMMTFKTENPESCGIVETDDKGVVIKFYEKVKNPPGNIANGAVYLLEPEVISFIEKNNHITDFSSQVIPNFIGKIATWHNNGIHRDIGTIESLRASQYDKDIKNIMHETYDWNKDFEVSKIFNIIQNYLLELEN